MAETPQMLNYAHTSNTYDGAAAFGSNINQAVGSSAALGDTVAKEMLARGMLLPQQARAISQKEEIMARRLVQVFIADPDPNVPLADCLLYRGEQIVTDATDQELFFDIDLKAALDQHNTKRTTLVNKKVRERVEHLEPARIRDLKMTVVEIAKF
jgi:hypothetical protein